MHPVTGLSLSGRCVLDVQKLEREVPHEAAAHITDLKDLAIRNIKRFSPPRSKSEIQTYMDQSFKVDGDFALGLPISILNPISEGICFSVNKCVNATFNFQRETFCKHRRKERTTII
jgi:hypothetical protein